MSGIIVFGYPGVGKSAIGGWNNCVDLESSNFSKGWTGNVVYALKEPIIFAASCCGSLEDEIQVLKVPDWCARYIDVGIDLAKQDYTVLMSTHKDVVDLLKAYMKVPSYESEKFPPAVIFCPDLSIKDAWIDRLQRRYDITGSPKDFRAIDRAKNYFEQDIKDLEDSGLNVYHPLSMNYDLKTYISHIRDIVQNVKERNGGA